MNFPTHGGNSNESTRKRRKTTTTNRQETAALVVARFATNLVDAQGAEAAIIHEPIEVLQGFEVVETVDSIWEMIWFGSFRRNKKMEEKSSE